MKLEELKKVISAKWRVQSFSKNKPKASIIAYIDARDAMDLLDEVCGPENWQDKYETVGDQLFCSVGIRVEGEWIWKTDTGSESNVEAEKGQVSDAFKRACVKWGIGRFLYSLPIKYVQTNGAKSDQNKYPYVIDNNGKRVWDITQLANQS